MPTETEKIEELASQEYKYGFYTDVEVDSVPPGLSDSTIAVMTPSCTDMGKLAQGSPQRTQSTALLSC